jgi:hypothetical protein
MLQTDEIKFIFVTTQNSILDSKGKNFVDSFNHFAKIFEDVNSLKDSVAICITKTDKYKTVEVMSNLIDDLKNANNLFSNEAKILIENSKKSIFVFKRPKIGSVSEENLLSEIDKPIKYLDLKPLKYKKFFKITISKDSQKLSEPLMK